MIKESLTPKMCWNSVSVGSSKVATKFLAASSALFCASLINFSPPSMAFAALSISFTMDEICGFCTAACIVIMVAEDVSDGE